MNRWKLFLIMLVAPLLLGQMCATTTTPTPSSSNCLTIDDVISIPPGNATGTAFSGTYRSVSIVQESCTQCDQNTIPESKCNPPVLPDKLTSVSQADGVLMLVYETTTAIGGINQDGTFRIGTIATPTNSEGVATGQGLVLFEGQFVGNRIIATATARGTMNDATGIIDLQAVQNITYERVDQAGQ